jgi:tRNA nucleotidyltransferase (CCA-adding enzyme)
MDFKEHFKLYCESKTQLPSNIWREVLASNTELYNAVNLIKEIKILFPQKDILIVGGTARDILLGIEIDDVDMATNIPFEELSKYFELRNISKNNSQPVYDILYNGVHYDLASFRTDSKNTNRKNNVSQTTDNFEVDSARRDITQNALGLTENGEIIDYQGGIDDMNNKVVRAVGDAKERFLEDASRILRVARFAAKLGFKIEANTRNAVIEMKHLLLDRSVISSEAISKEFYKAAKSGKTLNNFLNTLIDVGILNDVLPELFGPKNIVA